MGQRLGQLRLNIERQRRKRCREAHGAVERVMPGLHCIAAVVDNKDGHAAVCGADHFHRLGADDGRRHGGTNRQYEPRQDEADQY